MRKSAVSGAVAALLAGPVMADGFSYNYLEANFRSTEIEDIEPGVDLEGDGFGIAGSVEFGSTIHGFASVSGTEYEDVIDIGSLTAGLGFSHSLAPALENPAQASVESSLKGLFDHVVKWRA